MEAKQVVSIGTETFKSLTDGLALLNLNVSKPKVLDNTEYVREHTAPKKEIPKLNLTSCSTCKCSFPDQEKFRQHFKEDWHRYNLKQILKEREPISEEGFEELEDDVSSISGSESECSDDDDIEIKHEHLSKDARVLFQNSQNQVLSIYRCLISSKKDSIHEDEYVRQAKTLIKAPNCLIMMLGGGHFAATIFKDDQPILHKTFHSYTVRQKQGSSQSSNDNKGSFAKSAGASLRRYNETILAQHIQGITIAWAKEIEACDFIFYRAVGPGNKKAFFGGKSPPLNKTDPRLRTIPFNTRRATFNEVKKVYSCLKSVLVYDTEQVLSTLVKQVNINEKEEQEKQPKEEELVFKANRSPDKPVEAEGVSENWMFGSRCVVTEDTVEQAPIDEEITVKKNFFDEINDSSSEEERPADDDKEDEEAQELSDPEIVEAAQASKKKKRKKKAKQKILDESTPPDAYLNCIFLSALEQEDHVVLENAIAENEENKHLRKGLNNYIDKDKNTLLHIAAKKGYFHHIWVLLEAGASPCYKNKSAHTAYDVSLNKDTRDAFRRFYAEFPDKFDYTNSHIPKPLTDDLMKAQSEKKREKNKKLKQKSKEKKLKEKEEEDRQRFLQLSDREKRALAAERRILAQQAESKEPVLPTITSRCFACGSDMTGKIPFEYDFYKFCSMPCAKAHRNKKLEGS